MIEKNHILNPYVTLRVITGNDNPDKVSAFLGIQPTEIYGNVTSFSPEHFKEGQKSWHFSTRHFLQSHNFQIHLDWLLEKLLACKKQLKQVQKKYQTDISCYWNSGIDLSGPTISHQQSKLLAELNLEIWFEYIKFNDKSGS